MSITIANRSVKIGDRLFHAAYSSWVTIKSFDSTGAARAEAKTADGRIFQLLIQQGGHQNGRRVLYWHEPLKLDIPSSDISKYQAVVDLLVQRFGDK